MSTDVDILNSSQSNGSDGLGYIIQIRKMNLLSSLERKHSQWRRYGVAVLAVAIALLLKLLLNPLFVHESPFLLFFAAVLIGSRFGGAKAGLLATALSALVSDFFFLHPMYSFLNNDFGQNLRLLMFVLEGIAIAKVVASLKVAKQQAENSRLNALYHQQNLHQSEERYRAFIEQSSEGIWRLELKQPLAIKLSEIEFSEDEQIQHFYQYIYLAECNDVMARMYGFNHAAEIVGARLADIVPSDPNNIDYLRNFIRSGYRLHAAEFHVDRQGKSKYFWNSLVGIVENGVLVRIWGTQLDITERKQAEAALKQSEERFRKLTEKVRVIPWEADAITGKFTYVGPQAVELLGYPLSDWYADNFWVDRIHPEDRKYAIEYCQVCSVSMDNYELEYRMLTADRRTVWLFDIVNVVRVEDNPQVLRGFMFDLTERKQVEHQIKASLTEKEVLLKEIHHRVKNNLQIVSSLLNLQSGYIQDEKTLEILKAGENRIATMGLIHEQLYQAQDLAQIEFAKYIENLAANLFSSYNISTEAIALKINVDDVRLGIDVAIPCGLILNELISNSLKYAFPSDTNGEIHIQFHRGDNNYFNLTVSDNGIGFPKNLDFQNTESLGLQIVIALTNQLEGKIELHRKAGTEFKIEFFQQV